MLRKIVAAIRAALQFVTKFVMMPVQIAGKLVMLPVRVLQSVAGGAFGGGGGEAAEEATSAAQAEGGADGLKAAVAAARKAGSRASDVRFLAARRASGQPVADELWQRVSPETGAYLRALSSKECAALAERPLREVAAFLEGVAAIKGVRRPGEVAAAPKARETPTPAFRGSAADVQARLEKRLGEVRGAGAPKAGVLAGATLKA